jgi:hypothetical protein
MAVNWSNLASATACLLEYERLCERRAFIDEASLVRAAAEFIQSTTQLILVPEHNHPDLPGAKRLDLLGRTRSDTHASFVLEAKWIKSDGGTRQWAREVAEDILRLENLDEDVAAATDRALVIGGIRRSLKALFLEVEVRAGSGAPRVQALPIVLQPRDLQNKSYPYEQVRIPVRDCDDGARKFWRGMASIMGANLPVSYQCSLAGRHRAGPAQDAVEVYVWLIRRSRNRSTFNAVAHFADA